MSIEKTKILYKTDIEDAQNFIRKLNQSSNIFKYLKQLTKIELPHSYRWSIIYDYIDENCPENKDLVTGLTYVTEIAYQEKTGFNFL